MLFQTYPFLLIFLPLSIITLVISRHYGLNAFLLASSAISLIFYSLHTPEYFFLLFGSASFNYIIAGFITRRGGRIFFILGIAANLILLGYFKYANFFLDNISPLFSNSTYHVEIVLPLAISFITFEQIAFLHDVHFGHYKRGPIIQYLGFITFFPKLIAGPIIRYSEMVPQYPSHKINCNYISTGFTIFSFGLLKKVLLADYFGSISDGAYAEAAATNAIDISSAWMGFLSYPLQIFFDFSAYSEMAVGIAWMVGLRLPLNFDSPYKSKNIIDFWRRWHITLSAVLRDYLYIPLGGNRLGEARRYVNLMIVMLIGGLWHGAGWTFVVWGGLHGFFLLINHLFKEKITADNPVKKLMDFRTTSQTLTLLAVLIAWVFFRAPNFDIAIFLLKALVSLSPIALIEELINVGIPFLLVMLGWLWCLILPNAAEVFNFKIDRDKTDWYRVLPLPSVNWRMTVFGTFAFIVSLSILSLGEPVAFIYFQF